MAAPHDDIDVIPPRLTLASCLLEQRLAAQMQELKPDARVGTTTLAMALIASQTRRDALQRYEANELEQKQLLRLIEGTEPELLISLNPGSRVTAIDWKAGNGKKVALRPNSPNDEEMGGPDEQEDQKVWSKVLADALTPPAAVPAEIINLRKALAGLPDHLPPDKKQFVEAVRIILARTGYCIKVLPEGAIARGMYINAMGSLGFKCTDGSTPGLSRRTGLGDLEPRKVELIPYERPDRRRKNSSLKPSRTPN